MLVLCSHRGIMYQPLPSRGKNTSGCLPAKHAMPVYQSLLPARSHTAFHIAAFKPAH